MLHDNMDNMEMVDNFNEKSRPYCERGGGAAVQVCCASVKREASRECVWGW